ncbi:hypothetical protein TASI_0338 [Taylorella asinigenitalis MCE3]|uniref:Uncharacterized protein n=1 Tax=Taylorella asinigenitalis (strain MCE3) TaxID=1008459 RepID=G4QCI9_TAYAM|nr:hypothetical protein TASI_0338 [Taylorella asinigenitalis MCE3]
MSFFTLRLRRQKLKLKILLLFKLSKKSPEFGGEIQGLGVGFYELDFLLLF